ncbi:pyridoxamine 5'-phosphate oxidase family protein [Cryptosporangium japonicum]|uniref:Pyridoxamine 5'-phosphate oxidase family protein n=1 Tax=Cryptosporangium japonicum TaxID=80872 RepID=A0ABP3EN64_9ACTN
MSPFHRGELTAQKRAGVLHEAARLAPMLGRPEIPRGARLFLAEQPMLVLGATDRDGDPWATLLTGPPGFLDVDGPSTLTIAATPGPGDPLREALAGPVQVGMIVIEPETRRRVRMNGTAHPTPAGLRVELAQVYGNCPKYIQARVPTPTPAAPGVAWRGDALTAAALDFVNTADTFFITTADLEGHTDASHRGGNPGFLHASGPTRLRWPDYVGNSMFNTFGNLEVNPRAGLLLPDWATGTLLHLTGSAVVDWDRSHAAAVPGAQRLVDFTVERVVRVPSASGLRWSDAQFSRFNPQV